MKSLSGTLFVALSHPELPEHDHLFQFWSQSDAAQPMSTINDGLLMFTWIFNVAMGTVVVVVAAAVVVVACVVVVVAWPPPVIGGSVVVVVALVVLFVGDVVADETAVVCVV